MLFTIPQTFNTQKKPAQSARTNCNEKSTSVCVYVSTLVLHQFICHSSEGREQDFGFEWKSNEIIFSFKGNRFSYFFAFRIVLVGDLEITGRVCKLLKKARAHETFLKIQLELINLRKQHSLVENKKSSIQHSDVKLAQDLTALKI